MSQPEVRILLLAARQDEHRRLQTLLSSAGSASYQLHWCEQVERGVSEALSGCHDMILLDYQHLPLTAFTLLQDIVEQGCQLPVIAITDYEDSALSLQAINAGAMDYLVLDNLDGYGLRRCIKYALARRDIDRKLSQLSLYDPLTGIPNRMMFLQTLERAIEQTQSQQTTLALLFINLDGFKKINDGYGSEVGDQLVVTMARRLTQCVRKSDSVSRVGGDEFALVLDDCHGPEDASLVATKIIEMLSAPFPAEDQLLLISCSIGIALYTEAGDTVDGLLRRATMAMLEAKIERGSQFCFYSDSTNASAVYQLNLETELRRAIRNNEFEMYYQPRVSLNNGDTECMEALIRWRHPERGLVSPKEFITVAEESGLILPIGYWVIQQACTDLLTLDQGGHHSIDVAINISFKQLQDSLFIDTTKRIIEQSGIDPGRLEFELTETAIMSNYQQTCEGMEALSKLGITFSLDDFGTGFSSFAHIQRLPISALKVDCSFVRNVVKNPDDATIVKAMINLARNLRLQVIAEGVETLEQVQFLWQNRCDQVQGFYFSPAVSVSELSLLLEQRAMAVV